MNRLRLLLCAVVVVGTPLLASCGGGSGDSPGSSTGTTTPLFVEDKESLVIAVLPTLSPPAGSSLSANVISGFGQMSDAIAYDSSRDVLYVASDANVFAVASASTAHGHVTPARTIPLAHLQGINGGVAFDRANDRLYVGVAGDVTLNDASMIYVFDHVSTANGPVAPTKQLIVESFAAFAIDPQRGILYITGTFTGVLVYAGINGLPNGSSTLNAAGSFGTVNGSGIAIDSARDRLYVADSLHGVYFFNSASQNLTTSPSGLLAVPTPQAVAVDSARDRLYVGAFGAAYVFDNVSAATNGTAPAATGGSVVSQGSSFGGFAFP